MEITRPIISSTGQLALYAISSVLIMSPAKFDLQLHLYHTSTKTSYTMVFSATCFSNECGFCATCSARGSSNMGRIKLHLKEKEEAERASDLKKFMGKQLVEEETLKYHAKMKEIMVKADYISPSDSGFMRTRVNYEKGQGIDYVRYNLIRKEHKELCSDGHCQVFHHSAHETMIKSYYPLLPIYKRLASPSHNLCASCIQS